MSTRRQTNANRRAGGSRPVPFNPATDAGTLLLRFRGDDGSATLADSDTSYSSIASTGTIVGSVVQATTANRPLLNTSRFGKNAPKMIPVGRLVWNGANADLAILHDATPITITTRFYIEALPGPAQLFLSSMIGSPGNVGFHLKTLADGSLRAEIGNGVDILAVASAAGAVAVAGKYTAQLTKTAGAAWTMFIDGSQVAAGTRSSPSSAAPQQTFTYGGYSNNLLFGANATIPETMIHAGVHDAATLAKMRAYMAAWP